MTSNLAIRLSILSFAILFLSACNKNDTINPPTSMIIDRIEVIYYPEKNNGTSWDPTDGPDLTLRISKGNNVVWTSLYSIENPTFGNVQSFSMQPPYSFDSPSSEYTLSLFDDDTPATNELMGEITFTPYTTAENPPAILNLDNGGDVAFKIYVTYNY